MPTLDVFAYIPLFAVAVLVLATIIFLFVAVVKNSAKISFIFFLSLFCVLFGAIYTALKPNIVYFSVLILLATLLILPYAIVKAISDPDEGKLGENSMTMMKGGKKVNVIYEEVNRDIMDVQKDFLERALTETANPNGKENVFKYYCDQAIEFTGANGAMILLLDDMEDVISVKHLEGMFVPPYILPENIPHKQNRVDMSMKYAQFPLKDNIFGEVISNAKAELITEPLKDDRIKQNEKEDFLKCGSYIFVPLIAQSQSIGIMALSRNHDMEPFSDDEFTTMKKLADIMAIAIHSIIVYNDLIERSNLQKESEIASRIRNSLVPAKLPLLPGITVGAFYTEAESICSDFYDLLVARKDRIAFMLGDVTGKNLTSMTIITQIRAMLRLVINTTQTPATIISWVNRGLNFEANTDHFASISLIFYDSDSQKITYSSGGTNPIYIYKAQDYSFTKISDDSEPVGMEKETVYKDKQIEPASGDILVTCSDGFIEALNIDGEQYSVARLESIIKANAALSGKEIAEKAREDIENFCGSAVQHDDQSILVIKVK